MAIQLNPSRGSIPIKKSQGRSIAAFYSTPTAVKYYGSKFGNANTAPWVNAVAAQVWQKVSMGCLMGCLIGCQKGCLMRKKVKQKAEARLAASG